MGTTIGIGNYIGSSTDSGFSWSSYCTPLDLDIVQITGGNRLIWDIDEKCTAANGIELWVSVDGAPFGLLAVLDITVSSYDDLDSDGDLISYKARTYKSTAYTEFSEEATLARVGVNKSGILSTETWESYQDVHITDNITIGNGVALTVNAGCRVYCAADKQVSVSGTGQIIMEGTADLNILYTAESTTRGNIVFASMGAASNSTFKHVIFEKGLKTGSYGAAIDTDFSGVVIENCIFRNNTAAYGGAIFVRKDMAITILRSIFHTNIATVSGGGVYCWDGADPIVRNCLFYNNTSQGAVNTHGGGGLAIQTSTTDMVIEVLNNTFVNNVSNGTFAWGKGHDIFLYGASRITGVLANNLLWGASTSRITSPTSSSVLKTNNAIMDDGTGTNPINLNSDNNHAAGPNFNNVAELDFSLKAVSPCIDTGLNSVAGGTIPETDILGNPRSGDYKDRGCFEYQQ